MATPQRQYPPEPDRQPELTNLREGGAGKKVEPGWRFGFWWLWILVIAGIWYVGFGWGNSGGWIWGHHHAVTTTNDAELSGPGVPILNASNKQPFIGQAFQIRNVPVERQASPHALWIGSRFNSTPMLVVLPNGSVMPPPAGANPPDVPPAKGNTVTVTPNGAKTGAPNNTAGNQAGSGANTATSNSTNNIVQNPGDNAAQSAGNMNHSSANTAANTSAGLREWLDVTGRVVKAPSAAQAQQEWGLSQADANQLAQEGAYVQATQVQRAPQDR